MAAANFYKQQDFDLYAANFEDTTEYESIFDELTYNAAQEKITEINSTLRFYSLQLKCGYYEGTQIFIATTDEYCDDYYLTSKYFDFKHHGVNRYILRRMINAERKRINNTLLPLFKEYRFERYEIAARFSNGETWYKAV